MHVGCHHPAALLSYAELKQMHTKFGGIRNLGLYLQHAGPEGTRGLAEQMKQIKHTCQVCERLDKAPRHGSIDSRMVRDFKE